MDTRTITAIEIWVGGNFIGEADIGLPSPDLADLYPWMPVFFSANAGFSYDLDTVDEDLADGEHVIVVWTQDRLFGRNILGQRTFVVDNQSP